MDGDTSDVKKKTDGRKSEWKTSSRLWKAKGRAMDTNTAKAQDTRANPNSWETRLVRKRWDIELLTALSLRIMMMITFKHTHACMHTCIQTNMQTYMHAQIDIYIHTSMHTYIHT